VGSKSEVYPIIPVQTLSVTAAEFSQLVKIMLHVTVKIVFCRDDQRRVVGAVVLVGAIVEEGLGGRRRRRTRGRGGILGSQLDGGSRRVRMWRL